MEGAKRARFPVPLIAAAILFVPVVGAGVFVGRSIPERRTPVTTATAGSAPDYSIWNARAELASCQKRLAAQTEAAAASSTANVTGEPATEDAGRVPTTVEELEAERKRCSQRDIVTSAEVCSAAGRQFEALMALPKDGQMCGQKSRAADLVEENFEFCAVFGDVSVDIRSDDFTKEQANVIAEAIRVHRTLTEEELLRRLKEFVYTCTEVTPKRPPGLREPPPRKGVDQ